MRWRSWRVLTLRKKRFSHYLSVVNWIHKMYLTCLNSQAGKAIEEMERKCDQKLAECKEESKQYLMRIQEEQAALVCIKQRFSLKLYD